MTARTATVSLLLILCLAGSALAAEQFPDRLYTITGDVPVRENPSDAASQVRTLKAGQKVRVNIGEGSWATVFEPQAADRADAHAMGYARVAEIKSHGVLELAQANSIEVRKAAPDAKPEVLVNGRPEKAKPEKRAETKEKKADAKGRKADEKKPEEKKADEKKPRESGEIRVADRQLMVRAERNKDAAFRKLLHPGQKVRVAYHDDGWFAVFDPAETSGDMAKAWGYGRDKYLVPESAYKGPPAEDKPREDKPREEKPRAEAAKAEAAKSDSGKGSKADEEDVGYAIVERKAGKAPSVTLRVRLDLNQAPQQETLKRIVREIWKAERKKNEDMRLEVVLNGMDPHGLAYAVARFHEDGRLREFWWRDVVLGKPKK